MKSINNIFEMVKADRYTADGREEIIKAQEAETKDARRYKTGEISEATGLQKQPDGSWAPPKSTKYGKVTTNKEGKVGIQQTLGKGSKFEEFANEKSASRALANLTAGYNTTERSKEDPHSDKARQVKHWDKETEQIKKENKAERRAEHASHFQNPEAKGAGIPKADEKTFIGKTYKDFAESARASGYTPKTEKENLDGSSSTTFENKEGKAIRVDFDKNGKISKVDAGATEGEKQEEIGKFYTKFDDVQGAYDAGRQTFPEGGYTIFKTPTGQYKVVDDPKTKQRMTEAGYQVEVDVPEGTKPPKSPVQKDSAPLTGDKKIKLKK